MLKVTNIRVRSFDLDYLDLYWDIEPTFEDVNDFSFVVEKSYSQFGPYFDLTGSFRNQFHLRDTTVRTQHSFYTNSYYRVRTTNIATSEVVTYPLDGAGIRLEALPDLIGLEQARQSRLRLKESDGRKVWLFPRKKFGQRCSCYDESTQQKLRSHCRTCYDTSWVGGYDTPLETYAQIVQRDEQTLKTLIGEIETENALGLFSNYPELFEGWIVVEAENVRWRVGPKITKVRKARALVRQQAELHRIAKDDVEYFLPVNISDIASLQATPERNMTAPHSLEAVKIVDTALSIFRVT